LDCVAVVVLMGSTPHLQPNAEGLLKSATG
jgi:hypothetical protein